MKITLYSVLSDTILLSLKTSKLFNSAGENQIPCLRGYLQTEEFKTQWREGKKDQSPPTHKIKSTQTQTQNS